MTDKNIKKEGVVIEGFPNATFRVRLSDDNSEILAYVSGKMRINRIKILSGDKVTVKLSPYDNKRGRIVYRTK